MGEAPELEQPLAEGCHVGLGPAPAWDQVGMGHEGCGVWVFHTVLGRVLQLQLGLILQALDVVSEP